LLLILVAGGAAVYGLGLLLEIGAAKPPCCGLTWPSSDPLQAEQAIQADDPKGVSPDLQDKAARAILAGRPGDASAWLRLAFADRRKHGRLTETGQYAFQTSYLVQPYAGELTPWRVAFALDNWSQLTGQTRLDAVQEMRIVKERDTGRLAPLKALAMGASDPGGRLAAVLLLGR
jgi:hypothetical protein